MRIVFKIILYAIIVIATLFLVYAVWAVWFVANFHGESFPKSEKYIVNLSDDSIITKIKDYKIEHPHYRQYEIRIVDSDTFELGYFTEISGDGNFTTATRTSKSTWYTFSFFIEQCAAVVGCCMQLSQFNQFPFSVEIQLVSVTFSYGSNKTINDYKEISRKENKMIKKFLKQIF
jgi:hypothetical protein